jgi:hypothetical protein
MNQVEASKQTWRTVSGTSVTLEEISGGCLHCIADATEKMASSYVSIEADRDLYKSWYQEEQRRAQKAERSNASLRGVITKLKKARTGGK